MIRKAFLIISLSLCMAVSMAETIRGRIFTTTLSSEGKEPLVGAIVGWKEGGNPVISGSGGSFEIFKPVGASLLGASFVGYKTQFVEIKKGEIVEICLTPTALEIESVQVVSNKSNTISSIAVEKKELITFAGLCKMACCNIAESFENSASVTVGYSDAVSGARQIKMLGYDGNYTQMLDENRPIMRGLASTYGLEYTPGMWLSGIQISKGVTSVVNGFEALTGQINIEHRKPTDPERLFVNLFLDQHLRSEANVTSAFPLNDKLSTILLTHISKDGLTTDENGDGFMDMPKKEQYNVANRWLYKADNGVQIRTGVRFLHEERQGGHIDFKESYRSQLNNVFIERETPWLYGSKIENSNFNGYLKVGIPLVENILSLDDPLYDLQTTSNIAIVADWVTHTQNSYFGLKQYEGAQNSAFANLLYQINFGVKHKLITGASFTADFFKEQLVDGFTTPLIRDEKFLISRKLYNFDRNDFTKGLFGEYSFKLADTFDGVAALRADHSSLYGWMVTPRGHIKWNITPTTTFRTSAGLGYRAMSLVSDNTAILATGKELVISPNLDPLERGMAAGGSLTQRFHLFNDPQASLSVEYFRSQFFDRVIVDQEVNSSQIHLYNLNGRSYTDTYQLDFSLEPIKRFTIFATYRYNNSKVDLQNYKGVDSPLIDKFKGLINLQYATNYDRWTFDFTAQINGTSRLPILATQTTGLDSNSPIFPMFFAQVTYKVRNFEIYLGCENIANYKQEQPILSTGDPFSENFNSTIVWGPLSGRKFYSGVRYNLRRY